MADENYTLIISDIPMCFKCHISVAAKIDCSIYSCNHLICGDCRQSDDCFCRHGKFLYELEKSSTMKNLAGRIRSYFPSYVSSQDPEIGRKLFSSIKELTRLIAAKNKEMLEVKPLPQLPIEKPQVAARLEEVKIESKEQGNKGQPKQSGIGNGVKSDEHAPRKADFPGQEPVRPKNKNATHCCLLL